MDYAMIFIRINFRLMQKYNTVLHRRNIIHYRDYIFHWF